MGVGISPEHGERAERAVGGRPERIPEPETDVLAGRVPESYVPTGRAPESDGLVGRVPESDGLGRRFDAGPTSEREPEAWSAAGGTVTAERPSRTRTTQVRPFFSDGPTFDDGPATGPLPGSAPDVGAAPPASGDNAGEPANGHDPHEVTIQLDGASRGTGARHGRTPPGRPGRAGKDAPGTAEAADGPVFVDASGRRSRRFRRLGMLVAVACAVYAVVIVATLLSGNSNAPWLPVPGQEEDTPAGKVETSPLPTQSVNPAGGGAATAPGARARASDGTTPSPGSSASSGASASASATGASGDPKPSTSATKKPNPGVTPKDPDPEPQPSVSADGQPSASAPATTPGSTPAPTETTGTTGSTGAGAGTE
ncbi:hypothetical protein ACFVU0_24870 [Streptomyces sp. NPDC058122]|uniref:hypothetical protein n=1 Tax=Streptomyces sp. NPDC058122 TaxID=3346349 RepID=UPI0036E5776E